MNITYIKMKRFPIQFGTSLTALLILIASSRFISSSMIDDILTTTENNFIPPLTPSPNDDSDDWNEKVYDINELEKMLGGPLENRHFVFLQPTGGKMIEIPYKFRTRGQAREVRSALSDKYHLNETQVQELKKVPKGFNSTTVFIRYDSHKLSALERTGDSKAKLGDPCRATNIMDFDYCERAPFPNKGKMVCNTVNDPTRGLVPNTCICKYYRMHPKTLKWKQLPSVETKLNINGKLELRKVCLIPLGGICNHRISTGLWNSNRNAIYEVDICRGHYQCDNTQFLKGEMVDIKVHCTEKEFLERFDDEYQEKALLCSKPNSRKFSDYDEYKYYCLPKELRDLDEGTRSSLPPSTNYDADEKEEVDML